MRLYGMEDGIEIDECVLQWVVNAEGNLIQGGIDIVNCGHGMIDDSGACLDRYLIIVSGDKKVGENATTFFLTHGTDIHKLYWHRHAFISMEERDEFCKNINLARLAHKEAKKDFGSNEIDEMVRAFVREMNEKYSEQG